MNQQMIYLVGGIALAGVFALVLQMPAVRDASRRHAMALVIAAAIYLGFALVDGAAGGIAVEILGVLAFSGLAFVGYRRRSPALLALAWAIHPLWDLGLHSGGAGSLYTPLGYVPFCSGFDLMLALLIALGWAGRQGRGTTANAPASVRT